MAQNQGKFWIAGKCMGSILGLNLVNVSVSFHFPSGTSLPKKVLSTPLPRVLYTIVIGHREKPNGNGALPCITCVSQCMVMRDMGVQILWQIELILLM